MKEAFMKTLVVANPERDTGFSVTGKVFETLEKLNIAVLNGKLDRGSLSCSGAEALLPESDILIVIGGDGTILRAAQTAYRAGKPILGINVGTVGYMSSIEADELDLLGNLTSGSGYSVENRMLLNVSVENGDGNLIFNENALNETVISRGQVTRVLDFDVFCNSRKISSYRADGIILSTPTGSTAYSLSAGGPIVDPGLDSIIATPVCAHSFNSRSIIFRDDSVISVGIREDRFLSDNSYLTVDGLKNFKLSRNDIVRITRSQHSLGLIKLKNESFYDVLSRKIK